MILAKLLDQSLSLLGAVAAGDACKVQLFASQIRRLGWNQGMPALASAAGALELSLKEGPASEAVLALALEGITFEMRAAFRLSAAIGVHHHS